MPLHLNPTNSGVCATNVAGDKHKNYKQSPPAHSTLTWKCANVDSTSNNKFK